MKVTKRTVQVLELSNAEVEHLYRMVSEASKGHTVHYSEMQTGPSSFFGVRISEPVLPPARNGRENVLA